MSAPSPAQPSSGVSPLVLVLAVLLSVAATAAVVLYLRPTPSPAAGGTAANPTGSPALDPFTQKDTVSPKRDSSGKVFYPIPFAIPPSLKLTAARHEFVIVTQDEFGFTWGVRPLEEDLVPDPKRDADMLATLLRNSTAFMTPAQLKPGLVYEDFTWEAKGVRGSGLPLPREQTGSFTTLPNTDGEVIYPIPYTQPAHVELTGNNNVAVTEMRANGFKWKNVTKKGDEFFGSGSVTWKARGVRSEGNEK